MENILFEFIRIHAPSTCPHEPKGIYRTPLRYEGNNNSVTRGGMLQTRLGIGQIPHTPHIGHPVFQRGDLASQAAAQNACSGQYGAEHGQCKPVYTAHSLGSVNQSTLPTVWAL